MAIYQLEKGHPPRKVHSVTYRKGSESAAYGFRPLRGCADAIARCFSLLAKPGAPVWILEGDIKGCFDHISHDWLLDHILMDSTMLRKWLKSGYLENRQLYPSKEGTPQGSVISPTLANRVLDGLEAAIDRAAGVKHWGKNDPKRRINPNHIHLVRYADDFVVTCSDRNLLVTTIQKAIKSFLLERGLQLSEEKTKITHIEEGFDFLGQNVRKYAGKLLIKPSKKNVEVFLSKVKEVIKAYGSAPAGALIEKLSPMIRGWAMYHRHIVAKATFSDVDNKIWQMLWRWSCRRHAHKKRASWVKQRYFMRYQGQDWTFYGQNEAGCLITIFKASSIAIQRHVKIKATSNPYNREEELYFEFRHDTLMLNKLAGKHMMRYLYDRQKGCCPVCNQRITLQTGYHTHHLVPKYLGGKWKANNLVLVHPVCHVQIHHNPQVAAALTKSVIYA